MGLRNHLNTENFYIQMLDVWKFYYPLSQGQSFSVWAVIFNNENYINVTKMSLKTSTEIKTKNINNDFV